MRPGQHHNRRGRGRNNNRKPQNPLSRSYESNGPDVKVRGTPAHIAEKYQTLARDALSSGDPVLAENYLQHAEHYNRIIMAYREQLQQSGEMGQQGGQNRFRADGDGEDFGDDEAGDETTDENGAPTVSGSEAQPTGEFPFNPAPPQGQQGGGHRQDRPYRNDRQQGGYQNNGPRDRYDNQGGGNQQFRRDRNDRFNNDRYRNNGDQRNRGGYENRGGHDRPYQDRGDRNDRNFNDRGYDRQGQDRGYQDRGDRNFDRNRDRDRDRFQGERLERQPAPERVERDEPPRVIERPVAEMAPVEAAPASKPEAAAPAAEARPPRRGRPPNGGGERLQEDQQPMFLRRAPTRRARAEAKPEGEGPGNNDKPSE